MNLAHAVSTPILRHGRARRSAPVLRRWLARLYRVYGRAGMLELHR